ncbi:unnamed protein product [Caenorhabditis bovis]|uniref:Uncharacterized protein n=2 Tax=Caenorhabditis bovis TaxID=2654633 RepID=A0A8S1EC20_9PELO|nr:unnamed protein product [Caenorhabditis bovis]
MNNWSAPIQNPWEEEEEANRPIDLSGQQLRVPYPPVNMIAGPMVPPNPTSVYMLDEMARLEMEHRRIETRAEEIQRELMMKGEEMKQAGKIYEGPDMIQQIRVKVQKDFEFVIDAMNKLHEIKNTQQMIYEKSQNLASMIQNRYEVVRQRLLHDIRILDNGDPATTQGCRAVPSRYLLVKFTAYSAREHTLDKIASARHQVISIRKTKMSSSDSCKSSSFEHLSMDDEFAGTDSSTVLCREVNGFCIDNENWHIRLEELGNLCSTSEQFEEQFKRLCNQIAMDGSSNNGKENVDETESDVESVRNGPNDPRVLLKVDKIVARLEQRRKARIAKYEAQIAALEDSNRRLKTKVESLEEQLQRSDQKMEVTNRMVQFASGNIRKNTYNEEIRLKAIESIVNAAFEEVVELRVNEINREDLSEKVASLERDNAEMQKKIDSLEGRLKNLEEFLSLY